MKLDKTLLNVSCKIKIVSYERLKQRTTMKKILVGILILAFSWGGLYAKEFDKEVVLAALNEAKESYGLTAIVVEIRKGDTSVFQQALGLSTTDIPARMDMKARVGGVCLTSVTAILLQAVDEGVLTLEDTIDEWRPDLPDSNIVTLRMLANCTAGYGDYVPNEDFIQAFVDNPFRNFTPEELIAYGVGDRTIYEPGTNWNYSHTNFIILGDILSQVFGKSVQELLEERVFQPLNLQDTVYTPTPEIPGAVLHGFTTERGIFEDSTYWNPSWTSYSGSMAATMADVAEIGHAIVNSRLFSEDSLQEMIAPTTAGMGRLSTQNYYGLGIGVVRNQTWMLQNPNFGGYQGVMAMSLTNEYVVAVFATLGKDSDPATHHGMKLFEVIRSQLESF